MVLGDYHFVKTHAKLPAHIKKIIPAPKYTPPEIVQKEEVEPLTPEQEQEILTEARERHKEKQAQSRNAQAINERLANLSTTKPRSSMQEAFMSRGRRWNVNGY
jgi:hypothetical protein